MRTNDWERVALGALGAVLLAVAFCFWAIGISMLNHPPARWPLALAVIVPPLVLIGILMVRVSEKA